MKHLNEEELVDYYYREDNRDGVSQRTSKRVLNVPRRLLRSKRFGQNRASGAARARRPLW